MSKRIRSRQSAQIDRTNAKPENNIAEQPDAPMQSQAAETGKVTETCKVTIAAPEKPWEYLSKMYNAYAGLYTPANNPFQVKGTPTQPRREGTTNTNTGQGTRRYEWNGFAVTAILRWLGNRGIKAKAAGNALSKIGLADVSHATVQTQIQAGRKEGAKLPELTEEQANELLAAAA